MRAASSLGLLLLLVGCSDSTPADAGGGDARPDTSTVPACVAYDGPKADGWLPVDATGSGTRVPTCAARCGVATAFDGFPYAEALPSGSCEGAQTCDLAAVPRCGCAEDRGPVHGYRCTCSAGRWSCHILSQGGSLCRSSCADAAPDVADPLDLCPPLEACTGTDTYVEVFPFDPDAKCRRCATRRICVPDGCGTAPRCLMELATGRLHWAAYACGVSVLSAAGFRPCTDAEAASLSTWPPPPLCSVTSDAATD